jgi:hypothetical protein
MRSVVAYETEAEAVQYSRDALRVAVPVEEKEGIEMTIKQPDNTRWDGYGKWRPIAHEAPKPLECWVNVYEDYICEHSTEELARQNVDSYADRVAVHMLEASEVERRVKERLNTQRIAFDAQLYELKEELEKLYDERDARAASSTPCTVIGWNVLDQKGQFVFLGPVVESQAKGCERNGVGKAVRVLRDE